MIQPKVSDIVGIINKIAPFAAAETWDNVGLQVGDPAAGANRIMVALDPDRPAVEAAVAAQCSLLLTHHPLLFTPLKKISTSDATGYLVSLAIKNDLAIVSLHTNFDVAPGGMNDLLAERLGITDGEPLRNSVADELAKLTVFVPQEHEERVLEALLRFSALPGNYKDCSFRNGGVGTFTPLAGAHPFLGEIGVRQSVPESRIEVLVNRNETAAAVRAMLAAHPYEEPAFDIYPLLNRGEPRGLGRVGRLATPMSAGDFAVLVKERLAVAAVRFVGDPSRQIKKVAVCGGSGASLIKDACRQGADLLVTGDVKYHEAREAEAAGLVLIDAGHFATEILMVDGFAGTLTKVLAERKFAAEVIAFKGETEPFSYV
jgi:dinuclear metal center YbgI/SA1388 family protein